MLYEIKEETVDLNALTKIKGEKGIDSILIEGGGTLAFSCFQQGIVDKVLYYIAPKILGGKTAKTSVEGDGFKEIADGVKLKNISTRMVGNDICITAYVDKSH